MWARPPASRTCVSGPTLSGGTHPSTLGPPPGGCPAATLPPGHTPHSSGLGGLLGFIDHLGTVMGMVMETVSTATGGTRSEASSPA